jgi:hypothetical protein
VKTLSLLLGLMVCLCGTGCSKSGDAQSCPAVEVTLPPYPYAATEFTEESTAFLNSLASEYVCGLKPGITPDGVDFLLRFAPLKLFNDLVTVGPADIKKTLWVLHVSGYFGGIWLKANLSKFNASDGDDDSPHMNSEIPEDGNIVKAAAIAADAVNAASGSDAAALLEYNRTSLLAFLVPDFGIASDFGYNKGYMMQIFDSPPPGLSSPAGFIACDGILWCDYQTTHMAALANLKAVSVNLGGGLEPYASLGADVLDNQDVAEGLGRKVWGSFLDYTGMTQEFFGDLLTISASFLEVVQTAGLLSAQAVAEGNLDAGRNGANLQAGLIIWLSAYMTSFTSTPPADAPLPTLTVSAN